MRLLIGLVSFGLSLGALAQERVTIVSGWTIMTEDGEKYNGSSSKEDLFKVVFRLKAYRHITEGRKLYLDFYPLDQREPLTFSKEKSKSYSAYVIADKSSGTHPISYSARVSILGRIWALSVTPVKNPQTDPKITAPYGFAVSINANQPGMGARPEYIHDLTDPSINPEYLKYAIAPKRVHWGDRSGLSERDAERIQSVLSFYKDEDRDRPYFFNKMEQPRAVDHFYHFGYLSSDDRSFVVNLFEDVHEKYENKHPDTIRDAKNYQYFTVKNSLNEVIALIATIEFYSENYDSCLFAVLKPIDGGESTYLGSECFRR